MTLFQRITRTGVTLLCLAAPTITSAQLAPTVKIQPAVPFPPVPNTPTPPGNPALTPSLWNWNYLHTSPDPNPGVPTVIPNILQELYQESPDDPAHFPTPSSTTHLNLISRTTWAIAPAPSPLGQIMFSGFQKPSDAVINVEGGDLILTALRDGKAIRFGTKTLFDPTDRERMTIDQFGRVGIHDNTPRADLTINYTGANNYSMFVYHGATSQTTHPDFSISAYGGVGIGTLIDPFTGINGQYKLAVDGSIKAKEIVVSQQTWPDYVFADDYRLMPLAEVEKSIAENKHLPGIPSACTIESEGVALGETQAKLLEKIEELTLHLIDQNKQIIGQNERLKSLEMECASLKKRLEGAGR